MTVHEPQCQGEGDRHLLATDRNANGELVPKVAHARFGLRVLDGFDSDKKRTSCSGLGVYSRIPYHQWHSRPAQQAEASPTSSTEPGGRHTGGAAAGTARIGHAHAVAPRRRARGAAAGEARMLTREPFAFAVYRSLFVVRSVSGGALESAV